MGIVDGDLAAFELDGLGECRVERDVSGVVHLHLGDVRLELSPAEFEHLADVVADAHGEFRALKGGDGAVTEGAVGAADGGAAVDAAATADGATDADSATDVDSRPDADRGSESAAAGASETRLTADQRDALLAAFEGFRERGVPFVVLRGYESLPGAVAGSDVDLLVDADRFDAAAAVLGGRFQHGESRATNALGVLAFAARNPLVGARTLVSDPGEVAAYLRRHLVASAVGSRDYVERTFERDGLVVHVVNHLAYTSPMDGEPIRVARAVDDGLLARRREREGVAVPAPPDALAHLVCRGVFDYGGEFPARYEARCDGLRAAVFDDAEASATFDDLLDALFYDAAGVVRTAVEAGAYDAIRPRLAAYDDY